jgi:hypothetical protein
MPDAQPFDIVPPAGVVKTETNRVAEGRWIDTRWVRFVKGRPQKRGGWLVQTDTPMVGSARALHAFRDLRATEYIAAGTSRKLYIFDKTFVTNDITPFDKVGSLTNPFSTVSGSPVVSVAHTAHGRVAGSTVIFDGASAVGGLTIDGVYTVTAVSGANSYTITAGSNATSTAGPGGGSVDYQYEVPIGADAGVYGLGWGAGGWGLGTWGTARTSSTLLVEPRVWSLDHFGQNLLGSFNGGSLYAWSPLDGVGTRASVVAEAPDDIRYMFITEERFVMALCDDMRVRWCSQGNYLVWTPGEDNTANERRVQVGTKLIGGRVLGNRVSLIWTDAALYLFQYTGSQYIFDSRLAGTNCGLVSPSAAVTANGLAYWMGHETFFLYNGSVLPIPNVDDIKAHVFNRLRRDQGFICWGHFNPQFNEIVWHYVPTGSLVPGLYVSVCLDDFSWAVGPLTRLAGTNFTHGDVKPFLSGDDGHIYLHEQGYDADGEAIEASLTMAPSAIENGAQIMDIDGVVMDLNDQVGDVVITLTAWDRMRKPQIDSQSKVFGENDDNLVDFRVSGRYIGMTLVSNTVGGYFRYGRPTALVKPNGSQR